MADVRPDVQISLDDVPGAPDVSRRLVGGERRAGAQVVRRALRRGLGRARRPRRPHRPRRPRARVAQRRGGRAGAADHVRTANHLNEQQLLQTENNSIKFLDFRVCYTFPNETIFLT